MKKTFYIEGMSCKHCSNKISESLNSIEGIKAKVNLNKKIAIVSYNDNIDLEIVKTTIENDGYKVVNVI